MPIIDVQRHPDYEIEIRQVESLIDDSGITDFVSRHIEHYLWTFADTCPRLDETDLYLYKPDFSPLIEGEIAVFFTFELVNGKQTVMLRGITYTTESEMDKEA